MNGFVWRIGCMLLARLCACVFCLVPAALHPSIMCKTIQFLPQILFFLKCAMLLVALAGKEVSATVDKKITELWLNRQLLSM